MKFLLNGKFVDVSSDNPLPVTGGGGGGGGSTIDRELVVSIYQAKNNFSGATAGDTITCTQIIDVTGTPATYSTIWRNQTTAADLAGAPLAANLTLIGTGGASEATLAAMSAKLPATLGAKTSANSLSVALASDANAAAETGGNLAAIKANTDKIPAVGPALKAASQPVNIASDQIVPVNSADLGATNDAAATTDAGTFSLIALIKRLLGKFVIGQNSAAASLGVTLSSENILDMYVTGQSAQTAVVNNILTVAAGAASTDVQAYRSFAIQVVSTGTGGTFIFEGSNDNNNFRPIPVYNQELQVPVMINTAITATVSQIMYVGATMFRYIRVRIATTITGGNIQSFSTFCQTPFSISQMVIGQGTAANLNVTVASVAALASGQAAHSAAVSGNPLRVGGKVVNTSDLTLVSNDTSDLPITTGMQVLVKNYSASELDYTFSGFWSNSNAAIPFKNAAGASLRNYLTSLKLTADALATATEIVIRDGALTFASQTPAANVITSSAAHDLKIGDQFVASASTMTGLVAGTVYYVLTVPSTTTLTLSTTPGGATLAITGAAVTATANRILFRTKIQMAGLTGVDFAFNTPLRGAPNTTMDIQGVSVSATGSIFYGVTGYTGF